MKPLSIADYLNDIGRAATEEARPRRESSPFRPRSLPSVHDGEPGPRPVFNALANPGGGGIRKERMVLDARHGSVSAFRPLPRRGLLRRPARRSSPKM